MGFFSWKTQDSKRSIANAYSDKSTFPVCMTDDKGNKWEESNYDGYGVFGGKDYYELLSEMNGGPSDRHEGITIAYSGRSDIKWPNLTEDSDWEWINKEPETCPDQGYFYSTEKNEDDY